MNELELYFHRNSRALYDLMKLYQKITDDYHKIRSAFEYRETKFNFRDDFIGILGRMKSFLNGTNGQFIFVDAIGEYDSIQKMYKELMKKVNEELEEATQTHSLENILH